MGAEHTGASPPAVGRTQQGIGIETWGESRLTLSSVAGLGEQTKHASGITGFSFRDPSCKVICLHDKCGLKYLHFPVEGKFKNE
jgi:hypothetical protein